MEAPGERPGGLYSIVSLDYRDVGKEAPAEDLGRFILLFSGAKGVLERKRSGHFILLLLNIRF